MVLHIIYMIYYVAGNHIGLFAEVMLGKKRCFLELKMGPIVEIWE